MANISGSFMKSQKVISPRMGILHSLLKLPRQASDPMSINYGVFPCDSTKLNGEKYEGRSSGCNFNVYESFMGTIGETIERYCPAFYNLSKMVRSNYKDLTCKAIAPSEFSLFHQKQYTSFREKKYKIYPFDEKINLYWDKCYDLTNGDDTYCPAAFIYLPWTIEDKWILSGTSTGLAAHTNFYKAILTALYEIIERDAFVITWHQKLVTPKIIIDDAIQSFLDETFPSKYEFHFFDITYDLKVPTVLGFCFGESEYGKFVAIGTASRSTHNEALKKVILEISQSVPYFRYMLGERKDWKPSEDFNELLSFEDHSIIYLKRPELQSVLDNWRSAKPSITIDFQEKETRSDIKIITSIVHSMKQKNYNVLVKDITTPDANQVGYYCIRVIIPQLLQMGGAYPLYFLGGKRLYEVPEIMGYKSNSYDDLNKFPHPFP